MKLVYSMLIDPEEGCYFRKWKTEEALQSEIEKTHSIEQILGYKSFLNRLRKDSQLGVKRRSEGG